MDDKFMETFMSLSKDGGVDEMKSGGMTQRPLRAPPTAFGARSTKGGMMEESSFLSDQVTTLASYRPESAAFKMSLNRPKTGRVLGDGGGGGTSGHGRREPSARPSRSLASARPKSSLRKFDDVDSYIPDLDEVREEDLTMTVASAPLYEMQHMASLKELDAELSQTKALAIVDGVNLRRLCKFLVPEKDLVEHDEQWTWDRLYTEIMSSPELGHLVRFQRKDDMDHDSLSGK